ncbi:hypothetical protein J502_0343 [Acinetobacter sp. 1294596]|uniref:Uncharacterized protein n=1 Tax=Acinetobacter radioresistens SK82 TaxID=596318 RepID=A0ABP2GKZ3_ACIRA|nr:hypothetical protein ACIRA0001_3061 [Acinetobacter radioresistens SK82]EXB35711.1 hypothetical protein J546_0296 [Acinetobacter sp. 1461402]EXB73588.1 hypothetical protein J550_0856 [Acinetobacter sp. 230853]EXB87756.1 hypothetical protein J538_0323 [Acinetobacter sp. 272263]EXE14784.1 hypothetical protein J559_1175 [Acinetobacter sp. 983759]EXE59816.1 hypothetical protein J579_0576 [Acinetobacter sp. 1239920]EXF58484.1 hypothetical protein J502_0343 [Acinetobacter sp. 1294596]
MSQLKDFIHFQLSVLIETVFNFSGQKLLIDVYCLHFI